MKNKQQSGFIAQVLIILTLLILVGYVAARNIFHVDFGQFLPSDFLQKLTQLNPIKQSQPSTAFTAPASEATIGITRQGFIPATISIKKGSLVIWKNLDFKPHQPASDPHPTHTLIPQLGDGVELGRNDTFSLIFEKTGKFSYHDHLNPTQFKGIIIVE